MKPPYVKKFVHAYEFYAKMNFLWSLDCLESIKEQKFGICLGEEEAKSTRKALTFRQKALGIVEHVQAFQLFVSVLDFSFFFAVGQPVGVVYHDSVMMSVPLFSVLVPIGVPDCSSPDNWSPRIFIARIFVAGPFPGEINGRANWTRGFSSPSVQYLPCASQT